MRAERPQGRRRQSGPRPRALNSLIALAPVATVLGAAVLLQPLEGDRLVGLLAVAVTAAVGAVVNGATARGPAERHRGTACDDDVDLMTPGPGSVLDAVGIALAVFGTDGACLLANATARDLLDLDDIRPSAAAMRGRPVDAELVVSSRDASSRCLLVQSRPLRDPRGEVSAVVVTGLDVTGLRDQQRRAAWQSQHLALIADASRAVLRAPDARAAMCRSAVAVSGARVASLHEPNGAGTLISTCSHGGDLVSLEIAMDTPTMVSEAFLACRTLTISDVARDPRVNPVLLQRWTRSAERPECAAAWVPVMNRDRCVGVLAVGFEGRVTDWTARVQALEILADETAVALERQDLLRRLSAEAWSDGLTGAANRRAWDSTFGQHLRHARRSGRPLSVVLLDFDHFKHYNDEFGHLAGDDLLRSAVRVWRTRLRPEDVLCRWGGEEFAVLLPACALADAERLAADLRALVPEAQTVSAGVATWNGTECAQDLLARADAALYAAKAAGRDRVVADATQ